MCWGTAGSYLHIRGVLCGFSILRVFSVAEKAHRQIPGRQEFRSHHASHAKASDCWGRCRTLLGYPLSSCVGHSYLTC